MGFLKPSHPLIVRLNDLPQYICWDAPPLLPPRTQALSPACGEVAQVIPEHAGEAGRQI